MTSRKKLRQRHRRAKQRASQRRFKELEAELAATRSVATHAIAEMDRANRKLADKVLVALTFTMEVEPLRCVQRYRLRAEPAVWRSRVGLQTGEAIELCREVSNEERAYRLHPELENDVRRQLGSQLGAELLKHLQPTGVRA